MEEGHIITCPGCGKPLRLMTVGLAEDGFKKVVCPYEGCGETVLTANSRVEWKTKALSPEEQALWKGGHSERPGGRDGSTDL